MREPETTTSRNGVFVVGASGVIARLPSRKLAEAVAERLCEQGRPARVVTPSALRADGGWQAVEEATKALRGHPDRSTQAAIDAALAWQRTRIEHVELARAALAHATRAFHDAIVEAAKVVESHGRLASAAGLSRARIQQILSRERRSHLPRPEGRGS